MQRLKNKLAAFLIVMLIAPACRAQVYAQGIHAGGTTSYGLCSVTLPDQAYHFALTKICWLEDTDGLTYIGIGHQREQSDVPRASLEVEYGTNTFTLALDPLSIPPDFAFPRKTGADGGLPLTKGTGDLGRMITQCATNFGGRTSASTNMLSGIPEFWVQHSPRIGDFFVMHGDHFSEIKHYLESASGKNASIISDGDQPNSHTLTYTPAQVGIFLNLTSALDLTVVSVVGNPKP